MLDVGTHLGPYEVIARLGEGGMGEVYKARDTRLDRIVAIKVIRDGKLDEAHRARFEREARAVSALNDPHICMLHDVGQHNGSQYLVMEYVEGDTLAGRIKRGPLPLDQALRIAREIAAALEVAHRKGIVHRDLKPGNVMLAKSGVKLLDFGLAKWEGGGAEEQATLTNALTGAGVAIGTPQYMAPEQVEGRATDARTDVFAFGAVLYEMVTGKRAFDGKGSASVMAAILRSEPVPLSELQPMTPPALEAIVKSCLAKDPQDRWQSAHDIKAALALIGMASPVRPVERRGSWPLVALAAASLAAVVFAFLAFRPAAPPQRPDPVKFEIPLPPNSSSAGSVLPSPDGRHIVFRTRAASGEVHFWLRSLDETAARQLPAVGNAQLRAWSPDGKSVLVTASDGLFRVDLGGGSPQRIAQGRFGSACWTPGGLILVADLESRVIHRVPASGGAATPVTRLDSTRHIFHSNPQLLPDGGRFVYDARGVKPEDSEWLVGRVDQQPDARPQASIQAPASSTFVFGTPSYVLFSLQADRLMAQRFDPSRLRLEGEPFIVAHRPFARPGIVWASRGTLAYPLQETRSKRPTWYSRDGRVAGFAAESNLFVDGRISPDGSRIAFVVGANIWVLETMRGTMSRLTVTQSQDIVPVWSPDGKWIAFGSMRDRKPPDVWRKPSSGSGEEEFLSAARGQVPSDWSGDGRFLLLTQVPGDLFALPLEGDRKPFPFLATPFNEEGGKFSPDGKWIAYNSNESGRSEIYVRDFPGGPGQPKGKWQVSSNGGTAPFWSADGRELIHVSGRNVIAVPVQPKGAEFAMGAPKTLFQLPEGATLLGLAPDGRLLVLVPQGEAPVESIQVVLNWQSLEK